MAKSLPKGGLAAAGEEVGGDIGDVAGAIEPAAELLPLGLHAGAEGRALDDVLADADADRDGFIVAVEEEIGAPELVAVLDN